MATVHISMADVGPELAELVRRVQSGDEFVIGEEWDGAKLVAALPRHRTLDETIARLGDLERERGYPVMMDEDFAKDMREIIANRKPRDRSRYEVCED